MPDDTTTPQPPPTPPADPSAVVTMSREQYHAAIEKARGETKSLLSPTIERQKSEIEAKERELAELRNKAQTTPAVPTPSVQPPPTVTQQAPIPQTAPAPASSVPDAALAVAEQMRRDMDAKLAESNKEISALKKRNLDNHVARRRSELRAEMGVDEDIAQRMIPDSASSEDQVDAAFTTGKELLMKLRSNNPAPSGAPPMPGRGVMTPGTSPSAPSNQQGPARVDPLSIKDKKSWEEQRRDMIREAGNQLEGFLPNR